MKKKTSKMLYMFLHASPKNAHAVVKMTPNFLKRPKSISKFRAKNKPCVTGKLLFILDYQV